MNLNPILKLSIACEDKTNLGRFQVQNVIFLDCPTMIALDFCARSYSRFNYGQKTCAS
jgi:imidazoleglycerol phosphate dehydratase HisB